MDQPPLSLACWHHPSESTSRALLALLARSPERSGVCDLEWLSFGYAALSQRRFDVQSSTQRSRSRRRRGAVLVARRFVCPPFGSRPPLTRGSTANRHSGACAAAISTWWRVSDSPSSRPISSWAGRLQPSASAARRPAAPPTPKGRYQGTRTGGGGGVGGVLTWRCAQATEAGSPCS